MEKVHALNIRLGADDLAKLRRIAKSQHTSDNLSATVRALIRERAQQDADDFSRRRGNDRPEAVK